MDSSIVLFNDPLMELLGEDIFSEDSEPETASLFHSML